MNSYKITSLANGTTTNDAINYGQLTGYHDSTKSDTSHTHSLITDPVQNLTLKINLSNNVL